MVGKCSATTKSGAPCTAQAWRGGLCRWHAPELAEERAAWRAKGGANRSHKARARRDLPTDPKDLGDVKRLLGRALVDLEAGTLDPARGSAMAGVARAIALVIEKGEIEDRLSALEAAAGIGGKTA